MSGREETPAVTSTRAVLLTAHALLSLVKCKINHLALPLHTVIHLTLQLQCGIHAFYLYLLSIKTFAQPSSISRRLLSTILAVKGSFKDMNAVVFMQHIYMFGP